MNCVTRKLRNLTLLEAMWTRGDAFSKYNCHWWIHCGPSNVISTNIFTRRIHEMRQKMKFPNVNFLISLNSKSHGILSDRKSHSMLCLLRNASLTLNMQVFHVKQTKDNGKKEYITSLYMTLVVNMQQKGSPWGMVSVHVYPYVSTQTPKEDSNGCLQLPDWLCLGLVS